LYFVSDDEPPNLNKCYWVCFSEVRSPFRVPARTQGGNPIASPTPDVQKKEIGRTGPPDENEFCEKCGERPKNAQIVHGITSHVCCCFKCAQELVERQADCPVCKAPIDRVIRFYTN
jgi:E3 ubiquitin-protein ligase Mdm2